MSGSHAKSTYSVNDLAQVKALADPLRQMILGSFAKEPRTTKQVADLLHEKPTRLYHHVEILERAGLIKLVKTKQNRGTVERYYRAVANRFAVGSNLFRHLAPRKKTGAAAPEALFSRAFDATLREMQLGFAAKGQHPDRACEATLLRSRVRATSEQIEDLRNKLQAWLASVRRSGHRGPARYGILLVAYPLRTPKAR